jgi:hypothetical protein
MRVIASEANQSIGAAGGLLRRRLRPPRKDGTEHWTPKTIAQPARAYAYAG